MKYPTIKPGTEITTKAGNIGKVLHCNMDGRVYVTEFETEIRNVHRSEIVHVKNRKEQNGRK